MTWVLLLIHFTGPTSPDRVTYGGSFPTKNECTDFGVARQKDRWSVPEYVCFPVPNGERK